MRREGRTDAYEVVKDMTRGGGLEMCGLDGVDLPEIVRAQMAEMKDKFKKDYINKFKKKLKEQLG